MVREGEFIVNQKSYSPSKELSKFLEERLQLAVKHSKKRTAKESNRMSRRKNYYLNNYVFPSMANLIVFLEYASKKELRGVFDNNVKELLLSESALKWEGQPENQAGSKSERHRRPIFRRLIHAALAQVEEKKKDKEQPPFRDVLQEDYENIEPGDFKYLLAEMALKEITWMMLVARPFRFNSDTVAKNLLEPDIGRIETWLELLASRVTEQNQKFDPRNRPVLF